MIDRSVSLSTSNGYYRQRLLCYIEGTPVWITEPVDVLEVPVKYEVLPDDQLPAPRLPVAKARRIRTARKDRRAVSKR